MQIKIRIQPIVPLEWDTFFGIDVFVPTEAFKRIFFLKGIDYTLRTIKDLTCVTYYTYPPTYQDFLVTYNILKMIHKGKWKYNLSYYTTEDSFLNEMERRYIEVTGLDK